MLENKFKPDDSNAYTGHYKIITDFESDRKIGTSMFHIVPKDIVLSITFTIYLDQGKTCIIS